MDGEQVRSKAEGTAQDVGDSPIVEYGARVGFAANGLVHLLIAWIALRIAWSRGGGSADQTGALGDLASHSGGRLLLWVVVAGFVLLAVWNVTKALAPRPGEDGKDRAQGAVQDVAKAVMFCALAFAAFKFASGGRSSSSGSTRDFTATLMGQPGGRLLVAAIGVVILAVGVYHGYKGWTEKFREDLQEHPGRGLMTIARVGYLAKGVALGIVGALFVVGGWKGSTQKTTGLDGALRTLLDQPFGRILLTIVAIGIACYGVYSFACTKFAKV